MPPMTIDLYSSTGAKSGSVELPSALFEAPINPGLMHLALVRQQSNRRRPIAHVKTRGEVVGSTKKVYAQKGTGRARRGPIRSPILRGGGKTFGPRNTANFFKDMPKKMRRNALFSCLSLSAKNGSVFALESYPDDVKTKAFFALLKKLPVAIGRRILIVLPAHHRALELSARNVPRVKTLLAPYLNPEDVLQSKHIIFLVDSIAVAEKTFAGEGKETHADASPSSEQKGTKSPRTEKAPKKTKTVTPRSAKPSAKKSSSDSSTSA